jgi:hypothetical protein
MTLQHGKIAYPENCRDRLQRVARHSCRGDDVETARIAVGGPNTLLGTDIDVRFKCSPRERVRTVPAR